MKTKRGIYHNLDYSKYTVSNSETVLFFSSMFYLEKFLEEYMVHRRTFRNRLGKIMDVSRLNFDLIADLHLYKKIEKRGFKVQVNGRDKTWQGSLVFGLDKVTKRNTKDFVKIHCQK